MMGCVRGRPTNARVLALDPTGRVISFDDAGFSVPALNELLASIPAAS